MTESELMAANSTTLGHRTKWAIDGNDEAVAKRVAENKSPHVEVNPNNMELFYNRMLGLSDDGLRVIGKKSEELPR